MTKRGKRRLALLLGGIVVVVGLGYGALTVRRSMNAAEVQRAGAEGLALFETAEAKAKEAEQGVRGAAQASRAAYRKAAPLLRRYCQQNRTDAEALWALAVSQYNTVRPNGRHLLLASSTLRSIVALPPAGPETERIRVDAYEQLITIYGEVGYIPELREAADDLLDIDPDNILALAAIPESFLVLGEIDEAREAADRLMEAHPGKLRTFGIRNELLRRDPAAGPDEWAQLAGDIAKATPDAAEDQRFELLLLSAQVADRTWQATTADDDLVRLGRIVEAALDAGNLRPPTADAAEFYLGWVGEFRQDVADFAAGLVKSAEDDSESGKQDRERLLAIANGHAEALGDAAVAFEERVLMDPVLGQQLALRFVASAWWTMQDDRASALADQLSDTGDPDVAGWKALLSGAVIEADPEDDGPNAWRTVTASAAALADENPGEALRLLSENDDPGVTGDAAEVLEFLRGEALRRLGAYAEAEGVLREVSALEQQPARVQAALARLLLEVGQPIEAMGALTASDELPDSLLELDLMITDAVLTEADPVLFSMDSFERDRVLRDRQRRLFRLWRPLHDAWKPKYEEGDRKGEVIPLPEGESHGPMPEGLPRIQARFARASILFGEALSVSMTEGANQVVAGLEYAAEIADHGSGPDDAISLLLPVVARYAWVEKLDKNGQIVGSAISPEQLAILTAVVSETVDPITKAHRIASTEGTDAALTGLRDGISGAASEATELDARIALVSFLNQTAAAGELTDQLAELRELSDGFPESADAQRAVLGSRAAWLTEDGGRVWPGEQIVEAAVTRLASVLGPERTTVQVYDARKRVRQLSAEVERLADAARSDEEVRPRLRELRPRLNAIIIKLDSVTDATPDSFWGHYVESLAYRVSHRLTELERADNPEVPTRPDLENAAAALSRAVATSDRQAVTAYPELIGLLRDLGRPGEVDRRLTDFLAADGLPTVLVRTRAALLEENGRLRDAMRDRLDLVERPLVLMQDQIALAALFGLTGEPERGERVLDAQVDRLAESGADADSRAVLLVSIANAYAACGRDDRGREVLTQLPDTWNSGSGRKQEVFAAYELRHGDIGDAADQLAAAAQRSDDIRVWLDAIRAAATAGEITGVAELIATAPSGINENADIKAVVVGLDELSGETIEDPIKPLAAIALAMVAQREDGPAQALLRDRIVGRVAPAEFASAFDRLLVNWTEAPYPLHRVLIEQYAALAIELREQYEESDSAQDRLEAARRTQERLDAARRAVARVPADPRPVRDLMDAVIFAASDDDTEQARADRLWLEAEQLAALFSSLLKRDPFEADAYTGLIAMRRGNAQVAFAVLSEHAQQFSSSEMPIAQAAALSYLQAAAAVNRADDVPDDVLTMAATRAEEEEWLLSLISASSRLLDLDRRREWLRRIDTVIDTRPWLEAMGDKRKKPNAETGEPGYDPLRQVLQNRLLAWYALAETTGSEPDITAAETALAAMDNARPGTRFALIVSAMLAEVAGDARSARTAYESYLREVGSRDPGVTASLAMLLASEFNEIDTAQRLIADAMGRVTGGGRVPARTRARVHYARGVVRLEAGDLDGARDDLVEALDLLSDLIPARIALAEVEFHRGDRAAAMAELERLPDGISALSARERVKLRRVRERLDQPADANGP